MAMTDPLGDMLTRIRNGQQARKGSVMSPASNLRARVLDVLQREGYIRGYSEELLGRHKGLRIERTGTHHNALDDAIYQARLVQHILNSNPDMDA